MSQKIDKTGEVRFNNQGLRMEIIKYNNKNDVTIMFENGYTTDVYYSNFKKGKVNNPFYPSLLGIGYIGVGDYKTCINTKETLVYKYWKGMLRRCYDKDYHKKEPTYTNKQVCEEWHNFQNFAKWFDDNYYECNDGYVMELDKDILIKGNNIYSPATCIFVSERINLLFAKRQSKRGKYPIGVSYHKQANKFRGHMSILDNDGKQRQKHLGLFNTPTEAFECYKIEKEKYIKEVADQYKDKIPKKLYDAMYSYEVEITD